MQTECFFGRRIVGATEGDCVKIFRSGSSILPHAYCHSVCEVPYCLTNSALKKRLSVPLLTLTEPLSRLWLCLLLKSVEVLENLPGAIFKIPVSSGMFVLCLWIFAVVIANVLMQSRHAEKEKNG